MKVSICNWKTCSSRFSKYIKDRIENDIKFHELKNVYTEDCPCLGQCQKWPNVKIDDEIINNATPIKISGEVLKRCKK